MRFAVQATEDVAKRVYDGTLAYNTIVDVPTGMEAVHIKGGTVCSVVREGSGKINLAQGLKGLAKCRELQQIYVVNRCKQFEVLWGTGGIPFMSKDGKKGVAGANGSYTFVVDNSSALLRKFGYEEVITATDVKIMLKPVVVSAVRQAVLSAIDGGYNIGARTDGIRGEIQEKLEKEFDGFGLFLDAVRIEEISDVFGGKDDEETA
ncbi:MAG: hypothetical protein HFK09_07405 [Clostridia bacterium]|nr:hypothetical protein [Clostridia bacterium]